MKKIRRKCSVEYKVGDKIFFDGPHIERKLRSAVSIIVQMIHAFVWRDEFFWIKDRNTTGAFFAP